MPDAQLIDIEERRDRHGPELRQDECRERRDVDLGADSLADGEARHHHARLLRPYPREHRHELLGERVLVEDWTQRVEADQSVDLQRQRGGRRLRTLTLRIVVFENSVASFG